MKSFVFDKPACQNIRESLRKEWLETNGLGDYASSTIPCCNTRKYHGLLVANLSKPEGRHVLLSTIEESLVGGGKEFFISCRKHPGVYFPHGQEYMQEMDNHIWPVFRYRIGDLTITREVMMLYKKQTTLLRYTISPHEDNGPVVPLKLILKPLLAYRHFHTLTRSNVDLQPKMHPTPGGFSVHPYADFPSLFVQVSRKCEVYPSPDWCRNVQYMVEEERGFPAEEDLFLPAVFEIPVVRNKPIYVAASTEQLDTPLDKLWQAEAKRRTARAKTIQSAMPEGSDLMTHLAEQGEAFLITSPHDTPEVLAGYHWFDAWGRDTCIALPGLTVHAGRKTEGIRQLIGIGAAAKNGLIPNCIAPDGVHHAYNSVDASLWYIWAVQQFDTFGNCPEVIRDICWPVIKTIVDAFTQGPAPTVFVDDTGMLHAGDANTQLTWMDAMVDGNPVTPRHGCPVEINALWYNALAFADHLGKRYNEPERRCPERLTELRKSFKNRFWIDRHGGYLADVWREDYKDENIRPNQIFAVSLPYAVLEDNLHVHVVERVRKSLLTPFGLRTLSPGSTEYCGVYFGRINARDSAYHQGTVWPWLLGAYGDALLRTSWDTNKAVSELLDTLTPLFAKHLARAGLGSISEVFDASPPHYPNGCIAQAWSVAEVLRLLALLQHAAPETYSQWEAATFKG